VASWRKENRNEQKKRKLEGKESPAHSQPNYFSSAHTLIYLQPCIRRNHLRQPHRPLFSFFSLGTRSATTKLIGGRSTRREQQLLLLLGLASRFPSYTSSLLPPPLQRRRCHMAMGGGSGEVALRRRRRKCRRGCRGCSARVPGWAKTYPFWPNTHQPKYWIFFPDTCWIHIHDVSDMYRCRIRIQHISVAQETYPCFVDGESMKNCFEIIKFNCKLERRKREVENEICSV
jgi:hypothetical protein